jgi:hypothetical protein
MLRSLPEDQAQEIGHYIRRARQERELASKAIGSCASDAHLQRAKQYEALVRSAHATDDGRSGAADYECSNFTMISQKLFPFHQRTLRSALLG